MQDLNIEWIWGVTRVADEETTMGRRVAKTGGIFVCRYMQ